MKKQHIIKMPKSCGECRFCGDYTEGVWARNPHHCCELWWDLYEEDYKVNPNTVDEDCPLKDGIKIEGNEDGRE